MADDNRFDICRNPLLNIKYNLIQNIVQYEEIPSLQFLTENRIAILLWQNFLIQVTSSYNFDHPDPLKFFNFVCQEWQNEIAYLLPNFSLPKYCEVGIITAVDKIGKHILMYLKSLHKLKLSFSPERAKIYLSCLQWTLQGTIDYEKTASALVENFKLSTVEKYILACNYCLNARLNNMLQSIPSEFINNCVEEEDEHFHLMLFWTFHIRGEEEIFYAIIRRYLRNANTNNHYLNEPINYHIYLLEWAIVNRNEVAVQYIWENLNNSEIRENLGNFVKLALKSCSVNTLCYWLTQSFRAEEIQKLCTEYGYDILSKIAYDSRWRSYFLNLSKYVTQFIDEMNFYNALKVITICQRENDYELDVYKRVLNKFEFKFNIGTKNLKYKTIFRLIVSVEDERIIKLLLTNESAEDWKKFFYDKGMGLCISLILQDKLALCYAFIVEILNKKENDAFCRYFFAKTYFHICYNFVVYLQDYTSLDDFLKAFCRDCTRFKKRLPYARKGKIVGVILNKGNENLTFPKEVKIDRFLIWCFEGNETEIANCKCTLFDQENESYRLCNQNFLERMYVLMRYGWWEYGERVLKWAFGKTDNILKFKSKVASEMKISLGKKMILDFIFWEKNLDKLKTFVNYYFSENQIKKFKEEILTFRNPLLVIGELLKYKKFDQADNLLNWCFLSAANIAKYKDELMSLDGAWLFVEWSKCECCQKTMEALIEWYNPSLSSALSFKEILLNQYIRKRQKTQRHNREERKRAEERIYTCLSLLLLNSVEKGN